MDKKASGVAGKICCGIFCGLIGIALPVAEIVIGNSDSFYSLSLNCDNTECVHKSKRIKNSLAIHIHV